MEDICNTIGYSAVVRRVKAPLLSVTEPVVEFLINMLAFSTIVDVESVTLPETVTLCCAIAGITGNSIKEII